VITNHLRSLLKWFTSYRETWGEAPNPQGLNKAHFNILPSDFAHSQKTHDEDTRESFGQLGTISFGTKTRFSHGTNASTSSQTPRRNVKVSISDYPKFSGDAKDWISFSRRFLAVASSQGFEYIFQENEFTPITNQDQDTYDSDLAFMFDAFQNAWAGSRNYFLVQQAEKPKKDGRKIYMDAQNYFRGAAMEDSIIMENVNTLVNFKLSYGTYKGAEAYNDKFNETINNLAQQGQKLDDKLVKCLYLSNIHDKMYDTIKDQTNLSTLSLQDIQAAVLRKYLQMTQEKRSPIPSKRFANALQSFLQMADPMENEPDSEEENEEISSIREIFAMQQPKPKTKSGFPMIPHELYAQIPDEVKEIMRQQHAYYQNKYQAKANTPIQRKKPDTRRAQQILQSDATEPDTTLTVTNDETITSLQSISDVADSTSDYVEDTFQQFLTQGT
jgi:hypothetical protein